MFTRDQSPRDPTVHLCRLINVIAPSSLTVAAPPTTASEPVSSIKLPTPALNQEPTLVSTTTRQPPRPTWSSRRPFAPFPTQTTNCPSAMSKLVLRIE
ncbi:hypothetical protein CVS40_7190 [Lucilia cuprina]|nr:hypothetical protein CVS40_7190 [Lucilia cuprina]